MTTITCDTCKAVLNSETHVSPKHRLKVSAELMVHTAMHSVMPLTPPIPHDLHFCSTACIGMYFSKHGQGDAMVATKDSRRLVLAQQALVETGYFTAGQVSDDVAPRITEMASDLMDRCRRMESVLAAIQGKAQDTLKAQGPLRTNMPCRTNTI